ncbi:MAG: chaperone modulator CbpM [Amphritea sp.]
MKRKQLVPVGELLDDSLELSISELSERCAVQHQVIIDMVHFGVVDPQGQSPYEWRFSGYDLVRIRLAVRLQRDLEINLPGVALAIDLLEELDELRAKIRSANKHQ